MTQAEKMFVVKASTMKLGATRAYNLYSSMKGCAQYVHGTSDDFKNHIRDVNAFIGKSDEQMLINKMKNTKKYDMFFVPFTGIDNNRKCVTVGSRLLLREDTEAYTWLLTSFMTAHEKQPTMIVTDQDGAMKLAIKEVLSESKHRLCINKGSRRGERRKSGREIALKAKTKQIRKCLCCGEKTNKHTKSTCPSNPKYVAKLARLVAADDDEQGTTTATATEQATKTATAAEQGATTAAATEEATTTAIVSEEGTNAS
nr:hypothetical protein [Tanacetum cinerariifolium]